MKKFKSLGPEILLPLLFFCVLAFQSSTIGLTDDEAYYWVLAQKPAWGYAYHPPAVAWLIALFQKALGWIFGTHSTFLVRLPGVLCMTGVLSLSLGWLKDLGVTRTGLWRAGGVLLSFAGIFALSWMMVPDLPLFLGFTLAFVSVWRICFFEKGPAVGLTPGPLLGAFFGALLLLLSKYSGILTLGSAGLVVLFWVPRSRKWPILLLLSLGGLLGVLPALIWNSRHEWVSILYQIQERHGGASISWPRYFRFWIVEAALVGPIALGFAFWVCLNAVRSVFSQRGIGQRQQAEFRVFRYLAVWILPAAWVFCLQPLGSDFKPHWAFIVWWPALLGLSYLSAHEEKGPWGRAARFQISWGWSVGAFILLSCQLPIGSGLMKAHHPDFDARLDVTNDIYGWGNLRAEFHEKLSPEDQALPVVGSRYQTAAQAAFALGGERAYTMIPRDLKSRDEWPDLGVSLELPGQLPQLKAPVLFIRDNRYDALPEYAHAKCEKKLHFEQKRFGIFAKWIEAWRCEPDAGRP